MNSIRCKFARICLIAALLLSGGTALWGQSRQLQGVVTDAAGNPLPGVAVLGGKEAAITDLDGKYIISLPAG